ncbi:TPA: sugar transferase [Streptococcus suis]|uniref:sugar transferase n=1 Tax=Streptococcus TaxID=1301 RepID=UPI0015C53D07|nr:sugar transferase [Streptococcus suis]NQM04833.1 sugar transferase [Streptococcus suis]HEL2437386.1 sugar transferase [Streptococcus suis]HEM4266344.1 sugar transferase [Streptococcus suis]HEM4276240.1 sugar transferase [Streptococcus suis]HEM6120715.1 sugar transferase [Streptococcus suis]
MKVHITNLYGQSPLSVALMAQNMVADIAKKLDIKEIGIYSFNADGESVENLAIRFDGMNAAVGNGDVIIFQAPSWNGTHFDHEYIKRLKIYAGIKIVIFIHDIPPLMFSSNFYLMEKTIEMYNMADLIIAPSQKMLDLLYQHGLRVTNTLLQNMWDHKTDIWLEKPAFQRVLNFTGNPQRFHFVDDWQFATPLNLFAPEYYPTKPNNVAYQGWKYSLSLLQELNKNGGFGLVWSQGEDAEYYNLNVSYKLSTYIAAGLPVIAPRSLSNAHYISEYKLGFLVDSLEEANAIVSTITEEEYRSLLDSLWNFRELITKGYFAQKLLTDAVHQVMI